MECSGSSLIFSKLSLRDALQGVARLGFSTVEVGTLQGWAHISPVRAAADGPSVLRELQEALSAAGLSAVAFNAGIRGNAHEQTAQMDALAALAKAVGARTITIPTAKGPGIPQGEPERLRLLLDVVQGYGVQLAVETHTGTLAEDPETAVALCRLVPGLGLTLDPSHYWAGPAQGKGWGVVLPYVRQVHLRDAGFGGSAEIQVAPGKGSVDFAAVVAGLRTAGQTPGYSVEYIDTIAVKGGGSVAEAAAAMKALVQDL